MAASPYCRARIIGCISHAVGVVIYLWLHQLCSGVFISSLPRISYALVLLPAMSSCISSAVVLFS